jgi:hypothetical protein
VERTAREEALVDGRSRGIGGRGVCRAGGRRETRHGGESAESGRHAGSIGALALGAALAAAGCAGVAPPADLASAAVAARGGPLSRFERSSALDVHAGFPGAWQWQIGFEAPERLRLTIETSAETQTLVSDGAWLRTYVGDALVSQEPARGRPEAALVAFVALANLDWVLDPERVRVEPLDPHTLPAGTQALRGQLLDGSAAVFSFGFDARSQLVWLAGPAAVPGLGEGVLEARFEDFRRVERYTLPFAIHYCFRGAPLLDERVREWRVGDEASGASSLPGRSLP